MTWYIRVLPFLSVVARHLCVVPGDKHDFEVLDLLTRLRRVRVVVFNGGSRERVEDQADGFGI